MIPAAANCPRKLSQPESAPHGRPFPRRAERTCGRRATQRPKIPHSSSYRATRSRAATTVSVGRTSRDAERASERNDFIPSRPRRLSLRQTFVVRGRARARTDGQLGIRTDQVRRDSSSATGRPRVSLIRPECHGATPPIIIIINITRHIRTRHMHTHIHTHVTRLDTFRAIPARIFAGDFPRWPGRSVASVTRAALFREVHALF